MRKIPAILLLAAMAALPAGRAAAKAFALESFHSQVTVGADGSARVVESLTYTFDGKFSYAYRSIPLRDGDRVWEVEVSEGGRAYSRSVSELPGSFTVADRGDEIMITWYYRADDETRTFNVAYTIDGACTRHADVGEFYLTLFNNATGRPVGDVSARVTLPGDVSPADMRVFAHGPLHGEVYTAGPSTVGARVSPLPRDRFFDVRVLVPAAVFSGMTSTGAPALDTILAQEAQWAEEANRRREEQAQRMEAWREERARRDALAGRFLPVSILLGVISLAMWFVFFRRYGWPHDVTVHAAPGDPPTDHPPALVSYLVSRTVGGPALVATLVDLSDRGHLEVKTTTREKKGWFGSSSTETDYRFERRTGRDSLRPIERDLLDFTVGEVGDGRGFALSDFKQFASRHRSRVRKWFQEWSRSVKEAAKAEHFYEPYDPGAVWPNVGVGVAVMAAGIVIAVVTQSPVGIPAIAGGVAQALLSLTFTRHTPEGRRQAVAWQRFREHLKSVSRGAGRVSLTSHDWSRYLAAAILFGMHKKVLPALRLRDGDGAHVFPAWYVATLGDSSPAAMADGFSSMITSVSSTMSSSTGAGGGASAGGGGGAGGGSAGAG